MISIIVAIAKNYVIGKDNKIPWDIKEDMAHFRSYTLNKTVLMGKNTFLSIGKPLKHRTNIVVCNDDSNFHPEGIIIRKDLFEVLNEYKHKDEELVVIGGASIYKASLPFADKLVISHVDLECDGDTFFPEFLDTFFESEQPVFYDEFTVRTYKRK